MYVVRPTAHEENTLTIGVQTGYPPFEFVDDAGKVVGFDMDLGQLLADRLHKKFVIQPMEFEGIILSLKQGKIDLALSGMNITPSRLQEIEMVPYHGNDLSHYSLIFWEKIPANIKLIEDLGHIPGAVIAVESGSIPEDYLKKKHPHIAIKTFEGALNPLIDVKFGKSTANLVEPDVASYLKGKYPEIQVLTIPLSKEDQIPGFGIGIKKGNEKLLQEVTSLIEEFKASGILQNLENKWFRGEE
jgi:arginine transport system substrate-binding protein